MNTDVKILILGVVCLTLLIGINSLYVHDEESTYEYKTNYYGLFKLGLIPSAPMRAVEENDVDTGIKLIAGDTTYSLIESRTWITKDYGRTFVIPNN